MKNRVIALDVLRGIAVLLVLLHHTATSALGGVGWVGVDLFFVLSGFLVSGVLFAEYQRTGAVRPLRFLLRRGFKIYPPLYFVVGFYALYHWFYRMPQEDSGNLLSSALFYANYVPGAIWGTWSLAVEEHFYLLIALAGGLLAGRWRRRPSFRALPWVLGAIAILCLLARLKRLQHTVTGGLHDNVYPTHLRIDSIGFGVFLSYFYRFHRQGFEHHARIARPFLALFGALFLVPAFVLPHPWNGWLVTYGYTSTYLAAGCLLTLALTTDGDAPLLSSPPARALALVGYFSYSIYLWHMEVILKLWPLLRSKTSIAELAPLSQMQFYSVGAAILFGILAAKLVEEPMVKLRDLLVPAQIDPLAPPVRVRLREWLTQREALATAPDLAASEAARRHQLSRLVCLAALGLFGLFVGSRLLGLGSDRAAGARFQLSSAYPGQLRRGRLPYATLDRHFAFHTNEEATPTATILFRGPEKIGRVVVENRSECCADRAVPLRLEGSTDGEHFRLLAERKETFDTWEATFPPGEFTRLRLSVARTSMLHLDGVHAYAH